MHREAEGSAPELVGPAVRPEFNAENRQDFSLNETIGLDITAFGGSVTEIIPINFGSVCQKPNLMELCRIEPPDRFGNGP